MPHKRPLTVLHRTRLYEEAVAVVEHTYASDITLDEVARRIACSRRQLQRSYAEVGSTTFRDHLTGVRMRHAAGMLAVRRLTVREVARRVGYRQPAQFAKAFRRHMGTAPSVYRQRINGSAVPLPVGQPAAHLHQLPLDRSAA